jgi:hypothetical protein
MPIPSCITFAKPTDADPVSTTLINAEALSIELTKFSSQSICNAGAFKFWRISFAPPMRPE